MVHKCTGYGGLAWVFLCAIFLIFHFVSPLNVSGMLHSSGTETVGTIGCRYGQVWDENLLWQKSFFFCWNYKPRCVWSVSIIVLITFYNAPQWASWTLLIQCPTLPLVQSPSNPTVVRVKHFWPALFFQQMLLSFMPNDKTARTITVTSLLSYPVHTDDVEANSDTDASS